MSAAWIAFARLGNPEEAAPAAKDRATMVLDASSRVAGDYRRWAGLLAAVPVGEKLVW